MVRTYSDDFDCECSTSSSSVNCTCGGLMVYTLIHYNDGFKDTPSYYVWKCTICQKEIR